MPCRRRCPTRSRAGRRQVQLLRTYRSRRRRLPVRPGRGAQRRPRLRQGDRPRAQPDLPRGPVSSGPADVVALLRRRAALRPRAAPDRGHPAPPRSGRPVLQAAESRRAAAGAGRHPGRRRRPGRRLRHREPRGTPVYVHAKVCIVDDVWASVGSDNVNRRSWTHDSELSCAVIDERRRRARAAHPGSLRRRRPSVRPRAAPGTGPRTPGPRRRRRAPRPARPDRARSPPSPTAPDGYSWHDHGKTGPRPPGRLRPYAARGSPARTLAWATPLYRIVADPDARPRALRRAGRF